MNIAVKPDVDLARLVRLRSIQRFFSGSVVLPTRSSHSFRLTAFFLACSMISSTILEYFAKERAELYWCYDVYRIGQSPCKIRDSSKFDLLCMALFVASLVSFILSFLPWNAINLVHGVDRQRSVTLAIMKKRKQRLEQNWKSKGTTIDVENCLMLGGFEAYSSRSYKEDCVTYWEATKEELYTRVFSIVPCEIYCNWIHGHKPLSLLLVFFCIFAVSAHCFIVRGPVYVHCWILVSSTAAFLAPINALVWLTPLLFGSRHRFAGLCAVSSIVLLKVVGLVIGKHVALKHEQRLVKRVFRKSDLWEKMNIKEKKMLYLLGFDGFF